MAISFELAFNLFLFLAGILLIVFGQVISPMFNTPDVRTAGNNCTIAGAVILGIFALAGFWYLYKQGKKGYEMVGGYIPSARYSQVAPEANERNEKIEVHNNSSRGTGSSILGGVLETVSRI